MARWRSAPDDRAAVARLLNDEMTARFLRQSDSLNRIDTKGTALLGFALTIATFAATTTVATPWLLAVLASLACAAGAGIQTIRVRTYRDAPEPAKIKLLIPRTENAALAALIKAKQEAFDANAVVLATKAKWWRRSLTGLVAGVALLAIALLVDVRVTT